MIALDTDILIYAECPADIEGRHEIALKIMRELTKGGSLVPMQVLGEFMNVCRKRRLFSPIEAARKITDYATVFLVPPAQLGDLTAAAELSERHKIQFFDALILAVARRAGATVLLSEDMQDGAEIGGVRIVDPFAAANAAWLAGLSQKPT